MQNKVIEYVKQYAMITLSISIMSVGVYFFKFPNNFVFGGVTGMAALAAKLTPLSASAFSSAANMILLGVGQLMALGSGYYWGLLGAAALFVYQQRLIRERQREACFQAFLNNNYVGALVLLGVIAHYL